MQNSNAIYQYIGILKSFFLRFVLGLTLLSFAVGSSNFAQADEDSPYEAESMERLLIFDSSFCEFVDFNDIEDGPGSHRPRRFHKKITIYDLLEELGGSCPYLDFRQIEKELEEKFNDEENLSLEVSQLSPADRLYYFGAAAIIWGIL